MFSNMRQQGPSFWLFGCLVLLLVILQFGAVDGCRFFPNKESRASRWIHPRGGAESNPNAVAVAAKVGVLAKFGQTILEARRHLAAAAAARSSSIFIMYPVDTIKTRIQMEQANPFRLNGMLNGVTGSLFGQVPYGVLTFGSYEVYKRSLIERFPDTQPIFLYALAAIFGDLTGSGWLCPSEVVKQQLQAGMYPTMKDAVSGIMQKRGLIGFYQGYLGGVARDVPFRVAQLCSYEVTKNVYLKMKQNRRQKRQRSGLTDSTPLELSSAEAALCGAVAGTFSAAITSPLDRIKTLLMTDSGSTYGGSVVSCASQILRQEGPAGFFQGVVPRVVYIAPSVVIFFIVYEGVQQRLSAPQSPVTKKD